MISDHGAICENNAAMLVIHATMPGEWDKNEQGHSDYPRATDLLVLCEGGGSNNSSHYRFKEGLQA
ncbi:MAG: hypothetical protein ABI614_04155 [Planctomycetota bacterium]